MDRRNWVAIILAVLAILATGWKPDIPTIALVSFLVTSSVLAFLLNLLLRTFGNNARSGFSSHSCEASGSRRPRIKDIKINDSLYVLNKPLVAPEVDVLFFHGFHSSDTLDVHLSTWEIQHEDRPCIWPSAWLGERYPKARILYVSYHAVLGKHSHGKCDLHIIGENLASDLIEANVGQTPNCPVVLVGHCFGGLVIKQLCLHIQKRVGLRRSERERIKLENFLRRLKGVFFYGTPHWGSPCADKAWNFNVNPLLKYFKVLSKQACRMNQEFCDLRMVHDWRIQGLGESIPTSQGLFRGVVVAPEHCSRDGDEFNVVAADHVSITKPSSNTDRRFSALASFLHNIIDSKEVEVLGHKCQGLPDYPIDLEKRAQAVEEMLKDKAVVGIVGMGGVGKTTLAKQVYNRISRRFEYTCFFEDVKVITSGLSDSVRANFYRRGKGVSKIHWEDLRGKSALIVMDNVDAKDQLKILPHLGDGSKIIVTSRDKQVLKVYQKPGVYEVSFLEFNDAKNLFCRHAFGEKDIPSLATETNHLEENVEEVVRKCGGLPLTVEVIGCYLRGHSEDSNMWRETINKLGNAEAVDGAKEDDLWARLRVSYDALQEPEREMFREAGTIFFNKCLTEALAAWSTGIGNPVSRLENLVNRSLVKVYSRRSGFSFFHKSEEFIWVHEQLRDLAKNRTAMLNPNELSENATYPFQITKELVTQLNSNELNENTRVLDFVLFPGPVQLVSFARLKKLKYLSCMSLDCEGSAENFPRKLSRLTWINGWNTFFPISIKNMTKLAILELQGWNVCEEFSNELGTLVNLRILKLTNLTGLDSLPANFCKLLELKNLVLFGLPRLLRLPDSLGNLSTLEDLQLVQLDCFELPESFGSLSSLVSLRISGLKLASLPASFGCSLKSLKYLEISSCSELKCLSHSFSELPELQELDITFCDRLEELGNSFGNLSALEYLKLYECKSFRHLPESLGKLNRLKDLKLGRCPLTAIPDSLGGLSVLEALDITADSLESLPSSIGQLSSLKKLRIHCNRLEKLPESLGDLSSLEELEIWSDVLDSLPESIGGLKSLQRFALWAERVMILPESIRQLSSLKTFTLSCEQRERLPDGLGYLRFASCALLLCGSPTMTNVTVTSIVTGLGNLSNLSDLTLGNFGNSGTLPEAIGQLSSLRSLKINGCFELECLPDSLGSISSLREVEVSGCISFKTLPDSLGRPFMSQVAKTDEAGQNEELVKKPPSQPSASKGLHVRIHNCKRLPDSVMRSLGWVMVSGGPGDSTWNRGDSSLQTS